MASSGNEVGSFFLLSNEVVKVALPNIRYPPDTFDSYVTHLDSFTDPNGSNPETFQFEMTRRGCKRRVPYWGRFWDLGGSRNLRRKGLPMAREFCEVEG